MINCVGVRFDNKLQCSFRCLLYFFFWVSFGSEKENLEKFSEFYCLVYLLALVTLEYFWNAFYRFFTHYWLYKKVSDEAMFTSSDSMPCFIAIERTYSKLEVAAI